jgi:hypothetical protein
MHFSSPACGGGTGSGRLERFLIKFTLSVRHPARSAACKDALQTRDPQAQMGPGSALHRVRDDGSYRFNPVGNRLGAREGGERGG